MPRFIVVAPDSSEATILVTDELARILGVATADTLAGTTAIDATPRPASTLPAAVETIRAVSDDALITPVREAPNRTFDHVAWDLDLTASTHAGVILAFDVEGASAELPAEEVVAARLRAETATASIVAVVLTGGTPAVETDVPILSLPPGDEAAAALCTTAAPTAVTPLVFQADPIERARAEHKRIVLPEPDDSRVLQAAAQVLAVDIANTTFVDDADYVTRRAGRLGLDLSAAQVISVNNPAYLKRYAEEFAHLRVKRGVTLKQAREKVTNVPYFGTMAVRMGDADGMVSGAAHTAAHTIVPPFQIIKTAPDVSVVSSIFLMAMKGRIWAFGDCVVNPNPTAEQLADIAAISAHATAQFGVTPRVTMLSYSTDTSGSGPDVNVVIEATRPAREKVPELAVEGPIQFDAAVDTAVAATKLSDSEIAGKATIFVSPSLEAGNIGYKAVQRSSGAIVVSLVLRGLNKSVDDLSHGALVESIVSTVALTTVQTQG